MSTILAKDIVARASGLLQDPAGDRWKPLDLLGWLNDGQREIVLLKPDAGARTQVLTLVAGTRQGLPDNAVRLQTIVRNMGADGLTPGLPIIVVEREELDSVLPTWHSQAPAASIDNYVFDGLNPLVFYVNPPAIVGTRIEAVYQANPNDCTINGVGVGGSDSAISVNDIYQTALIEYLLHRAYGEQTSSQDPVKSMDHYKLFLQRLGLKAQVDRKSDPNVNSPPRDQRRAQGGADGPAF